MRIKTEVLNDDDKDCILEIEYNCDVIYVYLDGELIFSMDYNDNWRVLVDAVKAVVQAEDE